MNDLERALLGNLIARPSEITDAALEVEPQHMSSDAAAIYSAILSLHRKGDPVHLVSVVEELKSAGAIDAAGGVTAIAELTDQMPQVGLAGYTARKIRDARRRADARADLREADKRLANGDDPETVAAWLLRRAMRSRSGRDVTAAGELAGTVVTDVAEARTQTDVVRIRLLEPTLLPIHTGATYVIAGATSTGKSALADQIALTLAEAGWPVLVMGLEMSTWERTARLLSSLSGVSISAILCRELPPESINALAIAQDRLESLPVSLADCAGFTLERVCALIEREHVAGRAKAVVVDYIQLVGVSRRGRSREQEVSEVSRTISQLAARLGVAVLLVAQLSRLHLRERRPPELHDLRDSGQIEQDADTVIMLAPVGDDGLSDPRRVAYIRKQRFGQLGRIPLFFDGARLRYRRVDDAS